MGSLACSALPTCELSDERTPSHAGATVRKKSVLRAFHLSRSHYMLNIPPNWIGSLQLVEGTLFGAPPCPVIKGDGAGTLLMLRDRLLARSRHSIICWDIDVPVEFS